MPGRFIQVVNRDYDEHLDSMRAYLGKPKGTHWFVISNVFAEKANQVMVYDSFYQTISDSTKALLN